MNIESIKSTVEFKVMWYVEDKRHLKWKTEHDIPGNTFSLSWNIFIYIDIYTCTNYTPFLENCFEMFILSGLLFFFSVIKKERKFTYSIFRAHIKLKCFFIFVNIFGLMEKNSQIVNEFFLLWYSALYIKIILVNKIHML